MLNYITQNYITQKPVPGQSRPQHLGNGVPLLPCAKAPGKCSLRSAFSEPPSSRLILVVLAHGLSTAQAG